MLKRQEASSCEDLDEEPPYYPNSDVTSRHVQVINGYEPRMNGSRVNTAESTITHVSNDTLGMVTNMKIIVTIFVHKLFFRKNILF